MTMIENLHVATKRRRIIVALITLFSILIVAIVLGVLVSPHHKSNNVRVSLNVQNVTLQSSTTQQFAQNNNNMNNTITHQTTVLYLGNDSAPTTTSNISNQGSCSLDMSLDANLLHISCPRINNANQGFAMDTACKNGEHCVYACEPPFVSSSNGWSNDDCVPYLGRCNQVYDPAVYKGGLYCNNNGQIEVSNPALPLCVPGLNTSYITSNVPSIISSCQTVYPGNEAPMIGLEIQAGETKQITSFPQDYWQQTHAHFYVTLGSEKRREEACQWNYDPLSLNSGGVDTMPFIVGGGSLLNSPCKECGQHNVDFGENFDYNKSYSGLPNFGIRARNCNDQQCGKILCDATYRFNNETQELERYWVKYNTVYGSDKVGCVTDAVAGNAWNGDVNNVNKYTKFEYYEIDINTGNDRKCGSNGVDCFDNSKCFKIGDAKNANYGTGKNPATYVCTPVDGATHFTLTYLKSSQNNITGTLSIQTKTQLLYTVGIAACVVMIIAGFIVRHIKEKKSIPVPTTPIAVVNLNNDSKFDTAPRRQSIISEVPYTIV